MFCMEDLAHPPRQLVTEQRPSPAMRVRSAARARPLNVARAFEPWHHFDPGAWLDFNPSCLRLPDGRWFAVIRRDACPPIPGRGTVWTVPLDDRLQPIGRPTLLLARGEDPRAVCIGDRVFVFFAVIEGDATSGFTGSAVRLAECAVVEGQDGPALHVQQQFELPKNPLSKPLAGDTHEQWEKNWVPFPTGPRHVALIYSHEPWAVLLLDMGEPCGPKRFSEAHVGPALEWPWGEIRGGTVPVPHSENDDQLLTFFHSSTVVGGRKLYFVGACVFDAAAPFTPRQITPEPLLVAPYQSGALRFGWSFLGSVVFPLGAQPTDNGYRLLCGRDDGEIASFEIGSDELSSRLEDLTACMVPRVRNAYGETLATRGEPLAIGAFDQGALRAARLLDLLHPGGGLMIDAAPADGMFLARLACRFDRSLAFVKPDDAVALRRLMAVNELPQPLLFDASAARTIDRLDPDELESLALLLIDDGSVAEPVISGAMAALGRSRPLLLLQLPASPAAAHRVLTLLADARYHVEAPFPFTPTRRLALPVERRHQYSWMV